MSVGPIKLAVTYAHVMDSASFKRALLLAITQGVTFAHLSDFHRWLADRIESFGEEEFLYDPIPYEEYPGGQRAASQALLELWRSWYPNSQPSSHSVALTFVFDAHDLRCALEHAMLPSGDLPDLEVLDHHQILELCVFSMIERGQDQIHQPAHLELEAKPGVKHTLMDELLVRYEKNTLKQWNAEHPCRPR
jgi:hypothetical protein